MQRRDGRWVCVLDLGRHPKTKKRRRRVFYGRNGSDAQRKAFDWKTKMLLTQQELRSVDHNTIQGFLETWLRETVKPNSASTTHANYEGALKKHVFPIVGTDRVEHFDAEAASALYARLFEDGVTASVRDRIAVALHRAFAVREERDHVPNPLAKGRGVARPVYNIGEVRILNPKQVATLLAALRKAKDDRFAPLWEVLVSTGIRLGEALGLRWEDVDFKTRSLVIRRQLREVQGKVEIAIPKTARSKRTLPLGQVAVDALRRRHAAWKKEGHGADFIFTTLAGSHPRRSNLRRDSFEPALTAAKLPHITIHSLRHCAASFMAAAGADVMTIMTLLGQTRPGVTLQHYMHSSGDQQKRAVDLLDGALGRAGKKRAT